MSRPPNAETHLRSDFVRRREGPRSRLVPGRHQCSYEVFYCPACGLEATPPNNVERKCEAFGCGLCWQSQGNLLYLWK